MNLNATKSEMGDRVFLKTMNHSSGAAIVKVELKGGLKLYRTTIELVARCSLNSRDTLEQPTAVTLKQGWADTEANAVSLSAAAVRRRRHHCCGAIRSK